MKSNKKKLLLIELNEINFEIVQKYLKELKLVNFKKLIESDFNITRSENEYSKLEPWIQWVSVHTGKDAGEHKVYRLGDIVSHSNLNQIFEIVESKGFTVGCISPMNTLNKLKKPKYFIPDPWTATETDKSFWSRNISKAINQAVNDNSNKKIKFSTILILIGAFIKFSRVRNLLLYCKIFLLSFKKKWMKALFLDLFLSDVHFSLLNKHDTDFSTLFLNAGAHIQHHYLLSSRHAGDSGQNEHVTKQDPFEDMLIIYDKILRTYLNMSNYNVIVATGLSQIPYKKSTYYYRPKNHKKFLRDIGITFTSVFPRMTRDFLIEFDSETQANFSEKMLLSIVSKKNNQMIFKIDNRGKSLFVTLVYDKEILKNDKFILFDKKEITLYNLISFVAIKNGEHTQQGYSFFIGDICKEKPKNDTHVKNIFYSINNFFTKK